MDKKNQIDTPENIRFLNEIRKKLLTFGKDVISPDGTAYYLGDDGRPWPDFPRNTYETARMCHVYHMGAIMYGEGWKKQADGAMKGLISALHDEENGGWFDGLLPDGKPKEGKLCYSHAFVILAASDCLMAGDEEGKEFFDKALSVFDRYFWDEKDGMTCDTWDSSFSHKDSYRGLNANMHTVEALLNAADASGNEVYRQRAGRIIRRVVDLAAANEWRIPEHYNDQWDPLLDYNEDRPADPFKPYGATPGHGLEWARLILQWASSTFDEDDPDFHHFLEASQKLFHRAKEDAWFADGAPGFVYTTDWSGKPIVSYRMHWVLAEAINTAAVLYRVTNQAYYADSFAEFLAYLDEKVLDHDHGSWFHQLNNNNEVVGTVWPGKPDLYHAYQATLIPYCDVNLSVCKAVRDGKYPDTLNH